MNGPNSTPVERSYGETRVVLSNDSGDRLCGTSYALYPVDEPPLIEVPSIDRRWYRHVWEKRGWRVALLAGD
jgi:hypothetical protein